MNFSFLPRWPVIVYATQAGGLSTEIVFPIDFVLIKKVVDVLVERKRYALLIHDVRFRLTGGKAKK